MAHKTRIGGTIYSVSGGKTRVGGTIYSIAKGRTRVGGTGYDVPFVEPEPEPITITLSGGSVATSASRYSSCLTVGDSTVRYYGAQTLELPVGESISIYAKAGRYGSATAGFTYTYLQTMVKPVWGLSYNIGSKATSVNALTLIATYTPPSGVKSLTVKLADGSAGRSETTISINIIEYP